MIQLKANINEQEIAHEAYLLWEQDGKPRGHSGYYWQKAVERLGGHVRVRTFEVIEQ